jgi:hypothetical protein
LNLHGLSHCPAGGCGIECLRVDPITGGFSDATVFDGGVRGGVGGERNMRAGGMFVEQRSGNGE